MDKGLFVVNLSNLEVQHFNTRAEASRELGISTSNIYDVVSGRTRSALGYWFVADDDEAVEKSRKRFHGATKEGLWFAETGDDETNKKLLEFVVKSHHDSNAILKVAI